MLPFLLILLTMDSPLPTTHSDNDGGYTVTVTVTVLDPVSHSVKAAPEGEGPPAREEKEEGEKMQANPAYLPIEMMSYKSQESQYINVSS